MKKPEDDYPTGAFEAMRAAMARAMDDAWASTMEKKEEKPIPASWPQQKAIWAIMRRVAKGSPDRWKACDFDHIKKAADGRLNRKTAHEILSGFYDKDFHKFRGTIWYALCDGSSEGYDVDPEKFSTAVRRPRKDPRRFTWTPKDGDEQGEQEPGKDKPPTPSPRSRSKGAGAKSAPERRLFEVGDMVEYTKGSKPHADYPWLAGYIGKVVVVHNPGEMDRDARNYGVEWDPFPAGHAGHNCGGAARSGLGWNVMGANLKLAQIPADAASDSATDNADWPDEDWKAGPDSGKTKGDKAKAPKSEPKPQKKYDVVTEGYEKPSIFDDVCLMIESGVQVLLVGPSGCGKSMMITEIRKVLGKDLYVESFAGGKRYAQVFGSTHLHSGESKWTQAEFLKAIQKPGIVFMDEVMSADADVLIGCNSILDKKTRCFYTPEGKVDVHPECVIVGASNVSGREYSQNYKGTQQQDASILNRFVHVPMTYDDRVEKNLVKKSGIPEEDGKNLLAWLNTLRHKINANNIMYDPSTRKLVQATELVKMGMPAKKAFDYAFMTPLSELEKKKIGDIC